MEHPMDIQKSRLIESVSLISLQDSSVYIGEISKIEALDTLICIQDRNNKYVYIFSDKGKHISTISDQGHGAGEYLEVSDFFVDAEKKTINILSRLNKKLYVYDINGNGIQTISLPKTFSKIAKYADGFIGYIQRRQVAAAQLLDNGRQRQGCKPLRGDKRLYRKPHQ